MYTPYQRYMMKQADTRVFREMAKGWRPNPSELKKLQSIYKGYNEKTVKSLGHGASNQADLTWSPDPSIHHLPNHGLAVRKPFTGTESIPDILAHPDTKLVQHIQELQRHGKAKSVAKVYDVDPLGIQWHEYVPGEPVARARLRAAGRLEDYNLATKYHKFDQKYNEMLAKGVTGPKLYAMERKRNNAQRRGAVETSADDHYLNDGVIGGYKDDVQPWFSGPIDFSKNTNRPLQQRLDLAEIQHKFPQVWDVYGQNIMIDARNGKEKIIDMSGDYQNQYVEKLHPTLGGTPYNQLRHPSRNNRTYWDPVEENLKAQNAAHPKHPGQPQPTYESIFAPKPKEPKERKSKIRRMLGL